MTDHKAARDEIDRLLGLATNAKLASQTEATAALASARTMQLLVDAQDTANLIQAYKEFGRNPAQWPSEVREGLGL